MCVEWFSTWIRVHCGLGARGSRRRVWDSVEVELLDGYELPCWAWPLGILEEQGVLLTAEPLCLPLFTHGNRTALN